MWYVLLGIPWYYFLRMGKKYVWVISEYALKNLDLDTEYSFNGMWSRSYNLVPWPWNKVIDLDLVLISVEITECIFAYNPHILFWWADCLWKANRFFDTFLTTIWLPDWGIYPDRLDLTRLVRCFVMDDAERSVRWLQPDMFKLSSSLLLWKSTWSIRII